MKHKIVQKHLQLHRLASISGIFEWVISQREPLSKMLLGLNIESSPVEEKPCHGCELGKSSRLPFPSSSKRASSPLEIVHSDLVGPLQCKSIQGNTYFATFLDDFSKTVVVIFLKAKSEFK